MKSFVPVLFAFLGFLACLEVFADEQDILSCPKGTLKVARCAATPPADNKDNAQKTNGNRIMGLLGDPASFPVKEVSVCQKENREYAMNSRWATGDGDLVITDQKAEAKRLNGSQFLFSDEKNGAGLILNGDRQAGAINVCLPVDGKGNTQCISQEASCK